MDLTLDQALEEQVQVTSVKVEEVLDLGKLQLLRVLTFQAVQQLIIQRAQSISKRMTRSNQIDFKLIYTKVFN